MNQKDFGNWFLRFKERFPGTIIVIDNAGTFLGIRVPATIQEIPKEFLEDAVAMGLKIFFKT